MTKKNKFHNFKFFVVLIALALSMSASIDSTYAMDRRNNFDQEKKPENTNLDSEVLESSLEEFRGELIDKLFTPAPSPTPEQMSQRRELVRGSKAKMNNRRRKKASRRLLRNSIMRKIEERERLEKERKNTDKFLKSVETFREHTIEPEETLEGSPNDPIQLLLLTDYFDTNCNFNEGLIEELLKEIATHIWNLHTCIHKFPNKLISNANMLASEKPKSIHEKRNYLQRIALLTFELSINISHFAFHSKNKLKNHYKTTLFPLITKTLKLASVCLFITPDQEVMGDELTAEEKEECLEVFLALINHPIITNPKMKVLFPLIYFSIESAVDAVVTLFESECEDCPKPVFKVNTPYVMDLINQKSSLKGFKKKLRNSLHSKKFQDATIVTRETFLD